MVRETPSVWLLLPSYPASAEEEQSHLEEQWKEQQPWWQRWLWWWFVGDTNSFQTSTKSITQSHCPYQRTESTSWRGCQMLYSTRCRVNLSVKRSDNWHRKVSSICSLSVYSPLDGRRSIERVETNFNRQRALSSSHRQTEYNGDLAGHRSTVDSIQHHHTLCNSLLQHVVLLMRRRTEHWNGFDSTTDKQRYLLEKNYRISFQHVPYTSF